MPMSTWKRFEDMEVWQKARKLSAAVYRFTNTGPCAKDFAFVRQIRDAAVSVMSNVAEGFERDGTREFHQFVAVAKGSAGELRSQLYVALDVGYVGTKTFDQLFEAVTEVSRMLAGLMRYLERTEIKGHKFPSSGPSGKRGSELES
jgi:four helix bundle protein